jgi:glutathione S-transferase
LFTLVAIKTPWPLSYATKALKGAMFKNIVMPEFTKAMVYLVDELGEREWFNGKDLGRCDIMLSWPMDMIGQWGWVDFEKEYTSLGRWRKRILEREAWKRGIEKGNGYNLTDYD